jgi:hypothetical protein
MPRRGEEPYSCTVTTPDAAARRYRTVMGCVLKAGLEADAWEGDGADLLGYAESRGDLASVADGLLAQGDVEELHDRRDPPPLTQGPSLGGSEVDSIELRQPVLGGSARTERERARPSRKSDVRKIGRPE